MKVLKYKVEKKPASYNTYVYIEVEIEGSVFVIKDTRQNYGNNDGAELDIIKDTIANFLAEKIMSEKEVIQDLDK